MISVAIVEDELPCSQTLQQHLDRYAAENGIIFAVNLFRNALAFLNDTRTSYDIVFMDIEMPHENGLDAAAEMRRLNSESVLIFVTNMAQYAIRGYEVDAMDFLLKPVPYEVFSYKMKKALTLAEKHRGSEIQLKLKSGLVRIAVSDILYVQSEQHRIFYHTIAGTQETWGTLQQVEDSLKSFGFARCSSSCLVNLRCVTSVTDSEVRVHGETLPLSRGKKKPFLQELAQYLGV